MTDIINDIINAYKKYDCPKNMDCENTHVEFWIQCFKTGLKEIEVDHDTSNIKKEFADMAFIAIDGLNKMGFDVHEVLYERLEQNKKKDMSKRDISFYINKEKELSK